MLEGFKRKTKAKYPKRCFSQPENDMGRKIIKNLFNTWRDSAPANQATRGVLTSHTFLSKAHRSVYMLDRVARLPGAPCLLARGTRLGGVAFCHVNGSSRAISANRGEINRENITARGEYFGSYLLPVLSAEQNDSQSEGINVIDKSGAENRPVPVQEAEKRWKKVFLFGKGELCVNPSSRVDRLAGAPSLLPPCKQALSLFQTFS